ncbi:MAG: YadA-like family protein [Xanthomonadales bacterium]|nr:YadA-like family protein [Xanthomonadales bacterium]
MRQLNAAVSGIVVGGGTDLLPVANAFGGGANWAGGVFTAPAFTIQGSTYNNVGAAFAAIDTWMTNNAGGTQGPAGTGGSGAAHFFSVNSSDSAATNYNNDGATGSDATAVGLSSASGNGSTAVGNGNTASGDWSGAYGVSNTASATFAHAVGINNQATGQHAVAYGDTNIANEDGTTAFGRFNTASGSSSVAMGLLNKSTGVNGSAIGIGNTASADQSTAVGFQSQALNVGSTAIGYQSVADRDYAVSVGAAGAEHQIIHVAAGTADTDAVNVSQMKSGDAQTLASSKAYTDAKFATFSTAGFDQLRTDMDRRFHQTDRRIDTMGAMGTAMATMSSSLSGIRTQNRVGVGAGFQNGRKALSVGYQRAISDRATLTIGGAFSGGDKSVGVGGGFGW